MRGNQFRKKQNFQVSPFGFRIKPTMFFLGCLPFHAGCRHSAPDTDHAAIKVDIRPELGRGLIEKLSSEDFEPDAYEDERRNRVMTMIEGREGEGPGKSVSRRSRRHRASELI
jgi:non-homologous end joining protein Ku